mmetsp:Transcript_23665/g.60188  ORF Transcript_23665/g.60188 Transcript_23665/m.60188 type:complete len:466 (+) Transcript_23665:101-1498(+)
MACQAVCAERPLDHLAQRGRLTGISADARPVAQPPRSECLAAAAGRSADDCSVVPLTSAQSDDEELENTSGAGEEDEEDASAEALPRRRPGGVSAAAGSGPASPSSIGIAASSAASDESSEAEQLPRPLLMAVQKYVRAGRSPSDGVLALAAVFFRRAAFSSLVRLLSLPSSLDAWVASRTSGPPRRPEEREPRGRRLTLSQARLIIPRSISEYLECCRGARAHSEGLLFAFTKPEGAMAGSRNIVPRALSEGLLGGRLSPLRPEDDGPKRGEPKGPPPRTPAEDLQTGALLEGRIVRTCRIGLFVDVGATRCGLLSRRSCKGVPKWMLQKGEALSNLVVVHVNGKKRQFTLSLRSIGEGDDEIQEVDYISILNRIANWAGVTLPVDGASKDGTDTCKINDKAGAPREAVARPEPAGKNSAQPQLPLLPAPSESSEEAPPAPAGRKKRQPRHRGGAPKGAGKGRR